MYEAVLKLQSYSLGYLGILSHKSWFLGHQRSLKLQDKGLHISWWNSLQNNQWGNHEDLPYSLYHSYMGR